MSRRYARAQEIARLDPDADYERIFRLITVYEFPWDFWQSASLAFFRTFGIASIADLLVETGEIVGHTQKRADDTLLVLFEIGRLGLETEAGRAYLRRMNQMHRRYRISNDDNLYIIALYVTVPIAWINLYGWRKLSQLERLAMARYGHRLAALMGIKDAPDTYEAFADYAARYESAFLRPTAAGHELAGASMAISADRLPAPLRRPLGSSMRRFALALLDEPILAALGLPHPPAAGRRVATALLRFRGRLLRHLPPRPPSRPHRLRLASYPHGHQASDIGPAWMSQDRRPAARPDPQPRPDR